MKALKRSSMKGIGMLIQYFIALIFSRRDAFSQGDAFGRHIIPLFQYSSIPIFQYMAGEKNLVIFKPSNL